MFRDTSAQDRPLDGGSPLRRHWKPLTAGIAVVVLGGLAGPTVWRMVGASQSVSRSRLTFATVERGPFVRDIAAEGRVVASVSPTLYAPSAGTVTLKVHAGDAVERDQVLATLQSPELTSELALAQSSLEALAVDDARAALTAKASRIDLQQAVAEAAIDRSTAAHALASARKAFSAGGLPRLDVMRAEDALKKAQLEEADAQKKEALGRDRLQFEVKAKRLARDRQALVVKDLQRQVDALTLRSPVKGQVGQLLVSERAHVAKDAPLLTVVDLTALEVAVKVPESFAHDLAVGMPAELSGDGTIWKGQVSAISPAVVDGEVGLRVRFADGTPAKLRQNQRLSVRIVLDHRKRALTVARGTFVDESGGRFAYVVNDGIAERRPVRLGPSSIDRVVILEGLSPGDQVVVSGTDAFKNAPRVALSP